MLWLGWWGLDAKRRGDNYLVMEMCTAPWDGGGREGGGKGKEQCLALGLDEGV